MSDAKKVLFVGNRAAVYKEARCFPGLQIVSVLALQDSYLHATLTADKQKGLVFSSTEKQRVLGCIAETEFDLLLSNGCPFILPVSQLRRRHQLFLNVHPAFLPEGRGRHPVNGALLQDTGFIGATLHYMDDGVDTGNIVHQERLPITDDLDLGLLYQMSFELEARVFREGFGKLAAANFDFPGQTHSGKETYYSRRLEDQQVDLTRMTDGEILRRVRAFGIRSQGVRCETSGGSLRIFDAELITNSHLHEKYGGHAAGQVLLQYEDRLLVRSRDGIIKVKSYVRLIAP